MRGRHRHRRFPYRALCCPVLAPIGMLSLKHRPRREDSLRAVAFYESQRREREEREFREGREAMAREVAERNRRNGWPC
jgi:hypothetical protein